MMDRIKIAILFFGIILGLSLSLSIRAQEPQAIFAKAVETYNAGKFEEAAIEFEKLKEYSSSELYYNLANCYYKTNRIGASILYYEKALKLNPADEDAAFNLRLANLQTIDKIDPIPSLFLKRWWNLLISGTSATAWSWIAILLFVVATVVLALFFFSRNQNLRRIGFFGFILFFLSSLVSVLIAQSAAHYYRNHQFAIVMQSSVYCKSSPDEKGMDLFILHEGTKVELMERISSWQQIKLANGQVGWLKVETLAEI